jgi:hypothetical protein
MKLSSIVYASVVTLIAAAFAAEGALAAAGGRGIGITSGGGNKDVPTSTAQPTTNCPKDWSWNATAKKCVATDSINYNASKSNTGNMMAPAPATQTTNVHKPTHTSSTPPK